VLGFFGRFRSGGVTINAVQPDSPASAAGLQQGDVITKINGQSVVGFDINSLAGKSVKLSVTRRGEEIEVPMTVGSRSVKSWQLTSVPTPTAQQSRIRDAWLKR